MMRVGNHTKRSPSSSGGLTSCLLVLTLSGFLVLLSAWAVEARPQDPDFPQISFDRFEEEESGPAEWRQGELDRFKVALLNELGLSLDAEAARNMSSMPKANISEAEYARAYAEYMSVVQKRRRDERSDYSGPKERRRRAVRVIQAFESIGTELNLTRIFSDSDREEYQGRLLFNVDMKLGPGARVKRALLSSIPEGCHIPHHSSFNESSSDVTQSTLRWLAAEHKKFEPYSPFAITIICEKRGSLPIPVFPAHASLSVIYHEPGVVLSRARRQRRSMGAGATSLRNFESHNFRSRDCDKTRHGKTCCRKPMKVSFEELKIKDLILEPKEFNANMCSGRCNAKRVPYASTHAMFQHTLHQSRGKKEIPRPCCTPTKLKDLDVLHTVPGTSILKITILSNAIVEECSCS